VPEDANSDALKPYQRSIKAIFLAVAVGGSIVVTVSVADSLWTRRDPAPPRGAASDVLECNRDVASLLAGLGQGAAEVFLGPAHGAGPVADNWSAFTQAWQAKWRAIGERCQLTAEVGPTQGMAFERMQRVYRDLPAARLDMEHLVERFDKQQAGKLASMHAALEMSRAELARDIEESP
jgi:hypothetical protein